MRITLSTRVCFAITALLLTFLVLSFSGCSKEKVVIYGELPPKVILVYPPNSVDSAYVTAPSFRWEHVNGAASYHIQIASDAIFTGIVIGTDVGDTFYTTPQALNNGTYYWRVRAKNDHNVWGDWSDAAIWTFKVNDNSNYIRLLSNIRTIGIPQDVIIDNNIAYVADGEIPLTLVDVADPARPSIIDHVSIPDDSFAKAVWKRHEGKFSEFAFVADGNDKIRIVNVTLPLDPYAIGNINVGFDQNLEDIMGIVYNDSLYLLTVASGTRDKLKIYHIITDGVYYSPILDPGLTINDMPMEGDVMGVWYDTMSVYVQYRDTIKTDSTYYEFSQGRFVYIAVNSIGLWMIDVSVTHPFDFPDSVVELIGTPNIVGWGDTQGSALSVQTKGKFAYVADDRWGLQIFRLPDTISSYDNPLPVEANPVLIASINTSGRTKDLQLVGDYCFMADGSGGLKVVDIANPYAPRFVAAYTTPYAYGIWADSSYIYVTDRDLGLVIFENLVF